MNSTQDIYFCSEFKKSFEYNYNFNIPLDINIDVSGNNKIKLKLVDFTMMNTMLNISDYHKNNSFKINYDSVDYLITIPNGNYTAITLKDFLNTYLASLNIPLIFSYNKITNKYKLETTSTIILYTLNCSSIFGLNNNPYVITSFSSLTSLTYVNMLPYTKIILSCDLSFDNTTQHNFERKYSSNSGIGNIICWLSRDIPLFSTINHSNNNEIEISNKNIKSINFNITNEYQEFILDAPPCYIHLQLITYDNSNWFKKFYKILNDISYYLLSIYFKK